MLKETYEVTQSGRVVSCEKIAINKYENKLACLHFNYDNQIADGRKYIAILNPKTKRYRILPLSLDDTVTLSTDISRYPGIWQLILLVTEDDYEITNDDIDQTKCTYVSNISKFIVVRDNFLSDETIEEEDSPAIQQLIDETMAMRDTLESYALGANEDYNKASQLALQAQSSADEASSSEISARESAEIAVANAEASTLSAENAKASEDIAVECKNTVEALTEEVRTDTEFVRTSAQEIQTNTETTVSSANLAEQYKNQAETASQEAVAANAKIQMSKDEIIENINTARELLSNYSTIGDGTKFLSDDGSYKEVAASNQVQSDWTQNDESAPDYIKNRPFYTEEEVKNVLLEEQTLTVGDKGYAICDGALILEVGKTYVVNFNGTEYECVAREPDSFGAVIIGNGTIGNADDISNDEPFMFESYSDGEIYLDVFEPGDYTVSIYNMIDEVHKIAEKYLPEGCLQQSDYSQFNETAVDYIKNRPFYDDIVNKTLTFTNVGESGQSAVLLGNDLQLIDGETYTVTVNDESFSTEAVSNDNGTIIYLHHPTSSSIYDNVIICNLDGENSIYRAFSWWNSGSVVSISGEFRNFKQIDNKYLNVVTSFDGKTGDIIPEDTSFVSYESTIVGSTYPRSLIKSADGRRPYALDLGTTVLLGNTEDGVNLVSFSKPCILSGLINPTKNYHVATKHYVDKAIASAKDKIILNSSTEGSTKQFQITVDDNGTITATELQ